MRWGLEYAWVNLGGTFTSTTTIYAQDHSPADSALVSKEHYLTPFSAISGTGKTISSMVMCRLFRDATNATYDTYSDFAGLLEIDFHIECDSLGSHQEYEMRPEQLLRYMSGDVFAAKLCDSLIFIGHLWDDQIDKDKIRDNEEGQHGMDHDSCATYTTIHSIKPLLRRFNRSFVT